MIRSAQNRKIKDIRRLLRSKGDMAVLEGPHLVSEALAARIALSEVLATPEFLATAEAAALAARFPRPPLAVERSVLAALADADAPQGLLAIADLPRSGVGSLPLRADGIYVFAEGLQDPGNVGALARTCEAAGAVGLALAAGSAHPNHPRALRASAGSLLRLPVAVQADIDALDRRLRPLSPRRLALVPRGGTPWGDVETGGAIVLLLGAEGPGLSRELIERADLRVTIPLAHPVESLNATVAAAIVLFEIARRRR
jgi:TrmH family RNA methyltransferase